MADLHAFPGGALVEQGLRDLDSGRASIEARVVAVAVGRLRQLHLSVAREPDPGADLALYDALAAAGVDDPYGRANSLRAELTSFMDAYEAHLSRGR